VFAGETVEIETEVRQLRQRMGRFSGARVDGALVAEGRMTFALGRPGSR
jgi:hypothetical protein